MITFVYDYNLIVNIKVSTEEYLRGWFVQRQKGHI